MKIKMPAINPPTTKNILGSSTELQAAQTIAKEAERAFHKMFKELKENISEEQSETDQHVGVSHHT